MSSPLEQLLFRSLQAQASKAALLERQPWIFRLAWEAQAEAVRPARVTE